MATPSIEEAVKKFHVAQARMRAARKAHREATKEVNLANQQYHQAIDDVKTARENVPNVWHISDQKDLDE